MLPAPATSLSPTPSLGLSHRLIMSFLILFPVILLESSLLRQRAAVASPSKAGRAWVDATASSLPKSRIMRAPFTNRWKACQGFWIPDSFLPVQGKYHSVPLLATLRGKAICLQQHGSSSWSQTHVVQPPHALPSTLVPRPPRSVSPLPYSLTPRGHNQ